MKFSKRQVEILYYLNEFEETTLKQISRKIGVTTQTLKAEIDSLRDILNIYNIDIRLEMLKGLKVYGSNNLQQLLQISKKNIELPVQDKIVLVLLLNRDFLILQDIADTLFISKSQAEKIMPTILKEYNEKIISTRYRGYKFIGTEIERRKIFVHLISPYFQELDFKKCFKDFCNTIFNLNQFFSEDILEDSTRIIELFNNSKDILFIQNSLSQLFLYLIFILQTNKIYSEDLIDQSYLSSIDFTNEFKEYISIVKSIDKKLNLNIKTSEKNYLAYILFVLKKHTRLDKSEILIEMKEFINDVLLNIKQVLSIDFFEDKKLATDLSYHIYTAILTNIVLKNTYINEDILSLKNQYPLGYEMSVLTASLIKNQFNCSMDEYDLVCLSLHFQTAIERLKKEERKIKTVLVCDLGQAVYELIMAKIERLYPEILIEEIYSMQVFLTLDTIECDLIISTENIENTNIKTIYITPALKEMELKRISNFIRSRNTSLIIQDKIRNSIIVNIEEKHERDDIIAYLSMHLESLDCIEDGFLGSVYKREEISSTALSYLALPHGNPEFVKETKLIIARLKHPTKWGEQDVKCVFLLAVTKECIHQNNRVFTTFYKKVSQLEFEMQIIKIEDEDDKNFKKELIRLFD